MSDKTEKFCVDCKHHQLGRTFYTSAFAGPEKSNDCTLGAARDEVTGKFVDAKDCSDERRGGKFGNCDNGQWWEAKT